ncbi:hypothetical protein [Schleiferilactobacillus harbinensis]|uniref:hypothetical protein n=1 Tax=Schleiferilactobacillus harbinensis TaxID=304207 RepID=UPI0039E78661
MKTYVSVKIYGFDQEQSGNPDVLVAQALRRAGIKAKVHQQKRMPIYIGIKEDAPDGDDTTE